MSIVSPSSSSSSSSYYSSHNTNTTTSSPPTTSFRSLATLLDGRYRYLRKTDVAHQLSSSSPAKNRRGGSSSGTGSLDGSHGSSFVRTLTLDLEDEAVTIRLRHNEEIAKWNTQFVFVDASNRHLPFAIDKSKFYVGLIEGKSNSMVRLHIENETILGTITIGDTVYMIEPAWPYTSSHPSLDDGMIVYRAEHMKWPINNEKNHNNNYNNHIRIENTHNEQHDGGEPVDLDDGKDQHMFCMDAHPHDLPDFKPPTNNNNSFGLAPDDLNKDLPVLQRRTAVRRSATLDTCPMSLVADYKFFYNNGQDRAIVAKLLVTTLDYVNTNFRATSFGGTTDIGVSVKRVIVYESAASDPYYNATNWDVYDLLKFFGKTNWNDSCLAHLFTYNDFNNGIQGLAWVGGTSYSGICDGHGAVQSRYYNTGLTTGINSGNRILQLMSFLVTQHEVGHNFGASHDPSTTACAPSTGGYFVMWATSVDGSEANNKKFSSCSTASMKTVLDARSASCFIAQPRASCGNGRVESVGPDGISGNSDDEECDMGYEGDACCTSQCKLASGAACSDGNSECCENCQHAGVRDYGNGTVIAAKQCYTEYALDFHCYANTSCVNSSFSCPTLNQKPSGTLCLNQGKCVHATNPDNRCLSFCTQFGATPCVCSATAKECDLCCISNSTLAPYCPPGFVYEARVHTNGSNISTCFDENVSTYDGSTATRTPLRPFSSTCASAYDMLTDSSFSSYQSSPLYRSGQLCTGGVCDSNGACQVSDNDLTTKVVSIFSSITLHAFVQWMKVNLVGTIILWSLILWIPISCCKYCKNQGRLAKLRADQAHVKRLHTHKRHTMKLKAAAREQMPRNRVHPLSIPEGEYEGEGGDESSRPDFYRRLSRRSMDAWAATDSEI